MALLAVNTKWHMSALKLHKVWAILFFSMVMPVEVVGREKLKATGSYIFCANHFSYMDIPAFCLIQPAKFIGKSSLTRIPLFGYFFKKIHIPVTRESARSRGLSLRQTKDTIDDGFSVTFFPEGGIISNQSELPYMQPFKDGAFHVAIEKNRPIVPVTMPYNFMILPDESPVRLRFHTCKLIIHDPIYPDGSGEEQLSLLKKQVFNIIQNELLKHHPDKIKTVG